MSQLEVYVTKFHKDKLLKKQYMLPDWAIPIQAGAVLTHTRVADVLDSNGDNISCKNVNYCELTVLYWLWKNRLSEIDDATSKYYGLFHYRRWLDIKDDDIERMFSNNIDVLLPFPTIHEPCINEHHLRYVQETDWKAMLQALKELKPDYYVRCFEIFNQKYMYNYNILIAKADVLSKYCEWLFLILEKIEEILLPDSGTRKDRYIGYIGENLLTLYFMYHCKELKIAHAGKIMLI